MSDILDKLAKILNQAERASTEAEATAFFAQAQKLGTKYSIDLAVARSHVAKLEEREQPTMESITLGEIGRHNNAHFCELFMAIGRPNDLKFNIAHNSTYVIAYGMPSDIELTKALYATISQQMIARCRDYLASDERKNEVITKYSTRVGWVTRPVNGHVAKRSFYDAFATRISRRLRDAKVEAQREVFASDESAHGLDAEGKTGTELVLVKKELEVADFYKQKSTARGSWRGTGSGGERSSSGHEAGDRAARTASLGGEKSLAGGRKAIG